MWYPPSREISRKAQHPPHPPSCPAQLSLFSLHFQQLHRIKKRLSLQMWKIRSWNINHCISLLSSTSWPFTQWADVSTLPAEKSELLWLEGWETGKVISSFVLFFISTQGRSESLCLNKDLQVTSNQEAGWGPGWLKSRAHLLFPLTCFSRSWAGAPHVTFPHTSPDDPPCCEKLLCPSKLLPVDSPLANSPTTLIKLNPQ